jgi:hypothetical protein
VSYRHRINGMWRQRNVKEETKNVNERKKERKKYQGV